MTNGFFRGYKIINISGHVYYKTTVSALSDGSINLSLLEKGSYYLQLRTNVSTQTYKIVKGGN